MTTLMRSFNKLGTKS